MRRTKIVATLGPASDNPAVLGAMIDAGMDVARLGLAHGTVESHLQRIAMVRELAAQKGKTVAVLADLPGPKVRAGAFPDGGVFLAEADELTLVPGDGDSDASRITVDQADLDQIVEPADLIVMGDGVVTLQALSVHPGAVHVQVLSGGRLQGRPGVHLRAAGWQPPVPTDEDLELIDSVARQADWVAVSFVRRPDEMVKVREALGPGGPPLMAKIETRSAVDCLEDILAVSDGVMVARGDLGIDCPIEDVPYLQKRIIGACLDHAVPVITATQMLESMVTAPTPTRAEATDVANAVYDGTDALMLSGETAIGHDPALAVRTMARIATRAEHDGDNDDRAVPRSRVRRSPQPPPLQSTSAAVTHAMTRAAGRAATDLQVDAIVCCTRSGRTVRSMAGLRPRCLLVGVSPSEATARQLALSWGVRPVVVDEYTTTDEMVWFAVEATVRHGFAPKGGVVAVLAGAPDSPTNTTDVLRVVTID